MALELDDYENEHFKVLRFYGKYVINRKKGNLWECICKHCGNKIVLPAAVIHGDKTVHCGCLKGKAKRKPFDIEREL